MAARAKKMRARGEARPAAELGAVVVVSVGDGDVDVGDWANYVRQYPVLKGTWESLLVVLEEEVPVLLEVPLVVVDVEVPLEVSVTVESVDVEEAEEDVDEADDEVVVTPPINWNWML
jgi:poly-beta-hydroxyalkanoate depolymerase